MNVEKIIGQIWPGATLYVLLLTFAVAAFRYAQALRLGESRIYEEFLNRVQSIRETFQRRYMEPIVAKALDVSVEEARGAIVQTIRTAVDDAGYPLDKNGAAALLDQSIAAAGPRPSPGQKFLTSQDGTVFMEQLDRRQQKRQRLTASYDDVKRHTRNGYFSFFALSVILLVGLLSLIITIPLYLVITYINLAALVLMFGIYSVVSMFRAETALRDTFEQFALYAEEFE